MTNNVKGDGMFGEGIVVAADENILKMSPLAKLYRRSGASCCVTETSPTAGRRRNLADLNNRCDKKSTESKRHQSSKDSRAARGNEVDSDAGGRWQSLRNRYAKSSRSRRQTWPNTKNVEIEAAVSVAVADDLDDIIRDVMTKTSEDERTGAKWQKADDLLVIPDEYAIRCHGCAAMLNHDAISPWLTSSRNSQPSPRKDGLNRSILSADQQDAISPNASGKACHVCSPATSINGSAATKQLVAGGHSRGDPRASSQLSPRRQVTSSINENLIVANIKTMKSR